MLLRILKALGMGVMFVMGQPIPSKPNPPKYDPKSHQLNLEKVIDLYTADKPFSEKLMDAYYRNVHQFKDKVIDGEISLSNVSGESLVYVEIVEAMIEDTMPMAVSKYNRKKYYDKIIYANPKSDEQDILEIFMLGLENVFRKDQPQRYSLFYAAADNNPHREHLRNLFLLWAEFVVYHRYLQKNYAEKYLNKEVLTEYDGKKALANKNMFNEESVSTVTHFLNDAYIQLRKKIETLPEFTTNHLDSIIKAEKTLANHTFSYVKGYQHKSGNLSIMRRILVNDAIKFFNHHATWHHYAETETNNLLLREYEMHRKTNPDAFTIDIMMSRLSEAIYEVELKNAIPVMININERAKRDNSSHSMKHLSMVEIMKVVLAIQLKETDLRLYGALLETELPQNEFDQAIIHFPLASEILWVCLSEKVPAKTSLLCGNHLINKFFESCENEQYLSKFNDRYLNKETQKEISDHQFLVQMYLVKEFYQNHPDLTPPTFPKNQHIDLAVESINKSTEIRSTFSTISKTINVVLEERENIARSERKSEEFREKFFMASSMLSMISVAALLLAYRNGYFQFRENKREATKRHLIHKTETRTEEEQNRKPDEHKSAKKKPQVKETEIVVHAPSINEIKWRESEFRKTIDEIFTNIKKTQERDENKAFMNTQKEFYTSMLSDDHVIWLDRDLKTQLDEFMLSLRQKLGKPLHTMALEIPFYVRFYQQYVNMFPSVESKEKSADIVAVQKTPVPNDPIVTASINRPTATESALESPKLNVSAEDESSTSTASGAPMLIQITLNAPQKAYVEFAQFINDATINHSTDAVNLRAYKLLIIQFHSILSRPQFRQEAHPYLIYLTPIRDALRHDWDLLREKHQADLINILSATILNLIAVKNEGLTALGRIQGTYELLQKDGYFNLNRTHRHIDYRTDASINMINELLVELNQEVSKDEENNILQQLWQMDILASIGEILQYTHPRFKGITEAQMNTFIDCGNTTYHRAEENALKLVAALSEIPALQESISTQSKFHKKIK